MSYHSLQLKERKMTSKQRCTLLRDVEETYLLFSCERFSPPATDRHFLTSACNAFPMSRFGGAKF